LMAIPLGDHNPMYQWALAATVGGGVASLTNLGVTGARVAAAPANVASVGVFGIIWNCVEMVVSFLLAVIGGLCVYFGWIVAAFIFLSLMTLALVVGVRVFARRERRAESVAS